MTGHVAAVRARATAWRAAECDAAECMASGVVLVFDGEAYGWKNTLRDPQHERPGAMAVDVEGRVWIAKGGNDYDGAERWEPVNQ